MTKDPQPMDDFDDNAINIKMSVTDKTSNNPHEKSPCDSDHSASINQNKTASANAGIAATDSSSFATPRPKEKISSLTVIGDSLRRLIGVKDWSERHMGYDDVKGHDEIFLLLLFQSVGDSASFLWGYVFGVTAWSILCAWGSQRLVEAAGSDPGGTAERWVEDIENCKNSVSILGSLFVFTLVFRFNACYARWWEGRIIWGDMISKCIELGTMNRNWIADEDLADRMSRFIVAYGYASKAILRGKSLREDGEDGLALVKRELLTQEELDDMHENPCWQPHYCIQMFRQILVEAHKVPEGKGITFEETNKVHGQLFRCFDNTIKDLNFSIGSAIRVRSSGLPASYDAIVTLSYFLFFMIAAVVWGVGVGWMSPIIVFTASLVVMLLIIMGTKLVDPFGTDKVDIPLEAFCHTIESQIYAIDQRSKRGSLSHFARFSKPVGEGWQCAKQSSMGRVPMTLTAR